MNVKKYFDALMNGNFDQAEAVLKENIPSKLLKFIWLDGGKDDDLKLNSLEQKELWFSNISHFNDPFEFKFLIVNKEKLKKIFSEEAIKKIEDSLDWSHSIGISCLSNVEIDFLPMWSYYANNHRGFCIEYEVMKNNCIFEVLYEPERVLISNLIVELLNNIKKISSNDIVAQEKINAINKLNISNRILFQNLFIKSSKWRHEKEFRIPYLLSNYPNGMNVPICDLGLKTNRVICGYKCPSETQSKLNEISKKIGCGNAYKINMSDTKYSVLEEIIE